MPRVRIQRDHNVYRVIAPYNTGDDPTGELRREGLEAMAINGYLPDPPSGVVREFTDVWFNAPREPPLRKMAKWASLGPDRIQRAEREALEIAKLCTKRPITRIMWDINRPLFPREIFSRAEGRAGQALTHIVRGTVARERIGELAKRMDSHAGITGFIIRSVMGSHPGRIVLMRDPR